MRQIILHNKLNPSIYQPTSYCYKLANLHHATKNIPVAELLYCTADKGKYFSQHFHQVYLSIKPRVYHNTKGVPGFFSEGLRTNVLPHVIATGNICQDNTKNYLNRSLTFPLNVMERKLNIFNLFAPTSHSKKKHSTA